MSRAIVAGALTVLFGIACGDGGGDVDPCENVACADRGECDTDGVTAWCVCEQYYEPRGLDCAFKDIDDDGITDELDNCPAYWNDGQRDDNGQDDGDDIGDACESRLIEDGMYAAPVGARLHDGRVVFSGVYDPKSGKDGAWLTELWVFEPSGDFFAPTGATLANAHLQGVAITLPSGQVLLTGGEDDEGNATSVADLYDPGTDRAQSVGPMVHPRKLHELVLLESGDVLVVGGEWDGLPPPLEIFVEGDFIEGPNFPTGKGAPGTVYPAAVLLDDGRVLIAGGAEICDGFTPPTGGAAIYRPDEGGFEDVRISLNTQRFGHTMSLLPDGRVLVVGGLGSVCETMAPESVRTVELFDPATNEFTVIGESADHGGGAVVPLADGSVLAAGGFGAGFVAHTGVSRIQSDGPVTSGPLVPVPLQVGRSWIFRGGFLLHDGSVIIMAGTTEFENFIIGGEHIFPNYDVVIDRDHDGIVDVLDTCPLDPDQTCER